MNRVEYAREVRTQSQQLRMISRALLQRAADTAQVAWCWRAVRVPLIPKSDSQTRADSDNTVRRWAEFLDELGL